MQLCRKADNQTTLSFTCSCRCIECSPWFLCHASWQNTTWHIFPKAEQYRCENWPFPSHKNVHFVQQGDSKRKYPAILDQSFHFQLHCFQQRQSKKIKNGWQCRILIYYVHPVLHILILLLFRHEASCRQSLHYRTIKAYINHNGPPQQPQCVNLCRYLASFSLVPSSGSSSDSSIYFPNSSPCYSPKTIPQLTFHCSPSSLFVLSLTGNTPSRPRGRHTQMLQHLQRFHILVRNTSETAAHGSVSIHHLHVGHKHVQMYKNDWLFGNLDCSHCKNVPSFFPISVLQK